MKRKDLLLEVGQVYLAGEFEKYEYRASILTGDKYEPCLHLKNPN